MDFNNYLPIGTVCLLRGATKKIMIIGYSKKNSKISFQYDYIACEYPIGITKEKPRLYFLHKQIDKVFFIGYNDIEQKKLLETLTDDADNKKFNVNNVVVNAKDDENSVSNNTDQVFTANGNNSVDLMPSYNETIPKSEIQSKKEEIIDPKKKELIDLIPTQYGGKDAGTT